MARSEDHGGKGSADVVGTMKMPSDMLTPLTAGKDGAEPGPNAPKGNISWDERDPLGIVPGHGRKS